MATLWTIAILRQLIHEASLVHNAQSSTDTVYHSFSTAQSVITTLSRSQQRRLPHFPMLCSWMVLPHMNHINAEKSRLTDSTMDWKRCLGFPTELVLKKTLLATTQLVQSVEAETREQMRDHFKTRLPELRLARRNDIVYVDTFFSSVKSTIRGYT